ncbi:DUF1573 domain-containing protein [Aureispira anguillae]|uniref:DUF1573 domain-containing protein n=1 Tax=Aureispira anguillae TaxID=2864201 RepID=A0A915YGQ7_9BACT|nr:DUF1573 domain-containing protein [Aureispira anguillae]BDS12839.1 DUF1573 domain-containing protein [Aureispira anguillae]
MHQSVLSLVILLIVMTCSSCGTAQKLSKKQMEARISTLEQENRQMRHELEFIKFQIERLVETLPQPAKGAGAHQGGARPLNHQGGSSQVAANATALVFEKTIHDFGKIKEGESVTYTFKFKNTGEHPLIISNARGSCGCTVPKWPKEAIAPGEEGEIQVIFNSRGKKGKQHKSITLTANTDPANTRLYIKAEVGS